MEDWNYICCPQCFKLLNGYLTRMGKCVLGVSLKWCVLFVHVVCMLSSYISCKIERILRGDLRNLDKSFDGAHLLFIIVILVIF